MGNCITLNTTNLSNATEALADENFDQQKELLSKRGDSPALLWVAMFRQSDWKEAKEPDDYTHILPFLEISKCISNLEKAAKPLADFFADYGDISSVIQDLVSRLKFQKNTNVYIWTLGGDWIHEDNFHIIEKLEKIFCCKEGKPAVEEIAAFFELHLERSFFRKRKLIPPSKVLTSRKYDGIDQWNTSVLTGVHNAYCDEEAEKEAELFGW